MGLTPSPSASPTFLRRLASLDAALSLRIYTFFHPIAPLPLLKILELSGDGLFWFPLSVVLLLLFSSRSPLPLLLLLGSLLDLAVIGLLKTCFRRPRPLYNRGMRLVVSLDHWSFPSGHSSRVFFLSSFLSLSHLDLHSHFGAAHVDRFVLGMATWAAATSVSRVLLGRHFVGDVAAGACLGFLEGAFVFHCSQLLTRGEVIV